MSNLLKIILSPESLGMYFIIEKWWKLPVGTKIYSTNENELGILIVEYEGEDLYYMQLIKR